MYEERGRVAFGDGVEMKPGEARTAFDNAVCEALPGVDVLGSDDPAEADTAHAWVRTDFTHLEEAPAVALSGRTMQGFRAVATVWSPHGETSRGDVLAEEVRSSLANQVLEGGLELYDGRFADVTDEDVDDIENFRGVRVVFSGVYVQES